MEDTSLMNPDNLKREIKDVKQLASNVAKERADLKGKRDKIVGYIVETHNRGESSTLTHEQVSELIQLLSAYDMVAFRFVRKYEFILRVYRALMKDRRWFIGSRLRFLKK